MLKTTIQALWTEAGYDIFAREGIEGIQVERIARIIARNKSAFYHYFGDTEGYMKQLLVLHKEKARLFLADIRTVTTIDPDYLKLVVKHKIPVLFHIQLIRTKNPEFVIVAQEIDNAENEVLQDVWMTYVGIHDNAELAGRYLNFVRDMFYTRMRFSMDYVFLRDLMTEAKLLMQQFFESRHNVRQVRSVESDQCTQEV
jgi:AcrR family transcriptional regulator